MKLKNLDIEIVAPKHAYKHPDVYHSVLPQHEFSMLIVAPKGSGKTNLLCNLILKHYKKYFHRILVCSPTVMNDDKWAVVKETKHVLAENRKLQEVQGDRVPKSGNVKKVVFSSAKPLEEQLEEIEDKFDGLIPEEDFFSDLNLVIEKISEQQKIIKELHDKGHEKDAKFIADRMLVVLDDQAGMFKGGNVNNPMVNYVIKHRHASSSVIIVTQAYKAIPKTIRTNCNAMIIFDIPNLSELRAIYEENPEGLTEKEWLKVYKHATKDHYSFLYINNKFRKGETMFKRFDKLLRIKTIGDHGSDSEDEVNEMK
jgi:molybdopterin-guanine dinucleotide biosynthesis protein